MHVQVLGRISVLSCLFLCDEARGFSSYLEEEVPGQWDNALTEVHECLSTGDVKLYLPCIQFYEEWMQKHLESFCAKHDRDPDDAMNQARAINGGFEPFDFDNKKLPLELRDEEPEKIKNDVNMRIRKLMGKLE